MSRAALLLPALLMSSGCGGIERAAPLPSRGEATAGAASKPPATTEANGGQTGAAGDDLTGGQPAAGAPAIAIVDVPDEACSLTDAQPRVFREPAALELSFDRAGIVGDRRFAFDSSSLALMTFDANGSQPSPVLYADLAAAVGFKEQLVTLELGEQAELVVKSYDAMARPLLGSLELDGPGTGSHALVASPDALLAIWRNQTELRGRLVTPKQPEAPAFDFGAKSCGDYDCIPVALWTGQRFLVIWSRIDSEGTQLSWAAIDSQGRLLSARNVLGAEQDYRLAGAAQLQLGRLALLLTEGSPAVAPVLAFVDAFGTLEPTLQRFLGATQAWGIASQGDELAIVARSSEAQAVLRPLSGAGEVVSGWVCLDDSGKNTAFEPHAALLADGEAYEAVTRLTDGSAAQLALDAAGLARN